MNITIEVRSIAEGHPRENDPLFLDAVTDAINRGYDTRDDAITYAEAFLEAARGMQSGEAALLARTAVRSRQEAATRAQDRERRVDQFAAKLYASKLDAALREQFADLYAAARVEAEAIVDAAD